MTPLRECHKGRMRKDALDDSMGGNFRSGYIGVSENDPDCVPTEPPELIVFSHGRSDDRFDPDHVSLHRERHPRSGAEPQQQETRVVGVSLRRVPVDVQALDKGLSVVEVFAVQGACDGEKCVEGEACASPESEHREEAGEDRKGWRYLPQCIDPLGSQKAPSYRNHTERRYARGSQSQPRADVQTVPFVDAQLDSGKGSTDNTCREQECVPDCRRSREPASLKEKPVQQRRCCNEAPSEKGGGSRYLGETGIGDEYSVPQPSVDSVSLTVGTP